MCRLDNEDNKNNNNDHDHDDDNDYSNGDDDERQDTVNFVFLAISGLLIYDFLSKDDNYWTSRQFRGRKAGNIGRFRGSGQMRKCKRKIHTGASEHGRTLDSTTARSRARPHARGHARE